MSDHFVQHFLRSGDYVRTEFTCTAKEGAACRMICRRCADAGFEGCECAHLSEIYDLARLPDMVDMGSCGWIPWFTEDAPEEMYDGDEQPVRGPEPQAIEITWLLDTMGWVYE